MAKVKDEKQRSIEMMLSDADWPLLVLPLKQRTNEPGMSPLGYMLNPSRKGEPVTIVLGCMYDKVDKREVKNYRDVYAAVDDGWVVD